MSPVFYRSDQAAIHVTVAGVPLDNVVWDTMEGGDNVAEDVAYLPGGMAPQINLGGLPKRGDITVTRIWSDALVRVYKQLDQASGQAGVTVTYTVLDASGQSTGSSVTYTGVLKSVTRPNYDSNTSSEAKLQLVIGANQVII